MELNTKEDKVKFIRKAINSDEYIDLLNDVEMDELVSAIKKPVESRFRTIKETIERIIDFIITNRR